jgi:hypothetical protein
MEATRNLSGPSSRPRTPPSSSSNKIRGAEGASSPPPSGGTAAATTKGPPFKNYINFLSTTNDDWKADEDEMMGYEDDDGDDFGLPSLSNMKRRTRRMAAAQNKASDPNGLSPELESSPFQGFHSRTFSNSADIAIERPTPSYPMPKKSGGKILRPQYKEILRGSFGPSPSYPRHSHTN